MFFFKHHSKKNNVALLFHVFCFNAKFLATKKKFVVPQGVSTNTAMGNPCLTVGLTGRERWRDVCLATFEELHGVPWNAEIWMDFVEKWPSKTRKYYHPQKGSRMVFQPIIFQGLLLFKTLGVYVWMGMFFDWKVVGGQNGRNNP